MKDALLTILLFATCLLLAQKCSDTRTIATQGEAYEHLHDTAVTYRTKAGQLAARNRVLQLSQAQLASIKAGDDKLLAAMQAATDKYSTAAAALLAERTGAAAGATTKIVYVDRPLLVGDTTRRQLPTYYGTARSDGFTAEVEASPDSIKISRYTSQQELAVNFTTTGKGLFKKRQQTVEVTATSPGGKVLDVRAFSVPEQPPKRGIWFLAGVGVGFLGRPFITPAGK